MTASELKVQVDREVGNDTEDTRMKFLKFIEFGKRLAREEDGVVTVLEADHRVLDRSLEILTAVDKILSEADSKAAEVERVDEDAKFEEMKSLGKDGPVKAEMIAKFDELLSTVDQKHTAIFHERKAALAALAEKYFGSK